MMKRLSSSAKTLVFFILPFLPFCPGACASPVQGAESQFVLGTFCRVNLFAQGTPELYARVFARLHEIEDILSANRKDTDLDRVNQNAGITPVAVRREMIEVLEKALEYAEKSGGSFDPSIGPLVKLWNIGSGEPRVPTGGEIRGALSLTDYRQIKIDREKGTVFLTRPGMALDLGAIAKGYAADEITEFLGRAGVDSAIIDFGGNIFALGEKENTKRRGFRGFLKSLISGGKEYGGDESFWNIGIQNPKDGRGSYIGILRVKNKSVVTSGVYERFFEQDGKRYHHIFSVETGFPIVNDLLSVSIAADKSVDADALSTAAFSLGWEKGRALIASVPGAEGIFVFDDMTVRLTGNLEEDFTFVSAGYRHETAD